MSTLAGRRQPPPWLVVLAMQFSADVSAMVRAEGARSMALLLGKDEDYDSLLTGRLMELLQQDGILVPSLVLASLAAVKRDVKIDGALRAVVKDLAAQHPAHQVRKLATEFLGSEDSPRRS